MKLLSQWRKQSDVFFSSNREYEFGRLLAAQFPPPGKSKGILQNYLKLSNLKNQKILYLVLKQLIVTKKQVTNSGSENRHKKSISSTYKTHRKIHDCLVQKDLINSISCQLKRS